MAAFVQMRGNRFAKVTLHNSKLKCIHFDEIRGVGILNGFLQGMVETAYPIFPSPKFGSVRKLVLHQGKGVDDDSNDHNNGPQMTLFLHGTVAQKSAEVKEGDTLVIEKPFLESSHLKGSRYHVCGDLEHSDIYIWVVTKKGLIRQAYPGQQRDSSAEETNPDCPSIRLREKTSQNTGQSTLTSEPSVTYALRSSRGCRLKDKNATHLSSSAVERSETTFNSTLDSSDDDDVTLQSRLERQKKSMKKKLVSARSTTSDKQPSVTRQRKGKFKLGPEVALNSPNNSPELRNVVVLKPNQQEAETTAMSSSSDGRGKPATRSGKSKSSSKTTSSQSRFRKTPSPESVSSVSSCTSTVDKERNVTQDSQCSSVTGNNEYHLSSSAVERSETNSTHDSSDDDDDVTLQLWLERPKKSMKKKLVSARSITSDKQPSVTRQRKGKFKLGPKVALNSPNNSPELRNVVVLTPNQQEAETTAMSSSNDGRGKPTTRSGKSKSSCKTTSSQSRFRKTPSPESVSSVSSCTSTVDKERNVTQDSQCSSVTGNNEDPLPEHIQESGELPIRVNSKPGTPSGTFSPRKRKNNAGFASPSKRAFPESSPVTTLQTSDHQEHPTPSGTLVESLDSPVDTREQLCEHRSGHHAQSCSDEATAQPYIEDSDTEESDAELFKISFSSREGSNVTQDTEESSSNAACHTSESPPKVARVTRPEQSDRVLGIDENHLDGISREPLRGKKDADKAASSTSHSTRKSLSNDSCGDGGARGTANLPNSWGGDGFLLTHNQPRPSTSGQTSAATGFQDSSHSYSVPPGYTRISDVKSNTITNIYGVVKSFKQPWQSKGTDICSVVVLVDPSSEQSLECVLFQSSVSLLPQISCIGDIIRLHRIKISMYKDSYQALSSRGFSSLVFDRSLSIPVSKETAKVSTGSFTFTEADEKVVERLKEWCVSRPDLLPESELITVAEIKPRVFFDTICQVIGEPQQATLECVVLTVTDGTAPQYEIHSCDGDGDVITPASLTSHLPSVDIFLYGDHAASVRNLQVKEGTLVVLKSVYSDVCLGGPGASLLDVLEPPLQLCLYSGSKYGRGIEVLSPNAPQAKPVLERLA